MNTNERERELTLKETTTASLLSRLKKLYEYTFGATQEERAEIDSIEQELEERNEWESKASRW